MVSAASARAGILQVSVFLLGLHVTETSSRNNYIDYTYGGNEDYYNQAINYEDYSVKPVPVLCYQCMFMVNGEDVSGQESCIDPFHPEDIDQNNCKEGSCAKVYMRATDTRYTVTRTCLKNCQDHEDESGYTKCCNHDLCNGSRNASCRKQVLGSTLVCLLLTWILKLR